MTKNLLNLELTKEPAIISLEEILIAALQELKLNFAEQDLVLDRPTNLSFGDFTTNLALVLAKKNLDLANNPRELASKIVAQIQVQQSSMLAKVEVAGPGFINFTLADSYYLNLLTRLINNKDLVSKLDHEKSVVVEYSSPNIAKPFTIGHLRSTIIGDCLANLLEAVGYTVYRDNHLGDWGTQFGKQIYAIKQWGDENELAKTDKPVKYLVDLYVKFHQEAEQDPTLDEQGRAWFKKLEEGDPEAKRIWQLCINYSWKEFAQIYERLGVKFSENNGQGYGESFFEDKMSAVVEELKAKNLLQESQGAQLVFFDNDQYPPLMIIKKDGATLYATRDLATDKFRLEKYGKDILIINEVGGEQALYFQQLFAVEQMLGWVKEGQRIHIKHGLYRFSDKKMSTRKGNVIWLSEVLEEAFQRVKKIANDRINDDDVWKIAIGALKWNDLRKTSELDVVFNWDEILNLTGNSGPYLQYTYTRCRSVLEQNSQFKLDLALTLNQEEKQLLSLLTQFREAVFKSVTNLSAVHLCTYLYQLAQTFNLFYNKHSILQASTEPEKNLRLALTSQTASVLKFGLAILGIAVPSKM